MVFKQITERQVGREKQQNISSKKRVKSEGMFRG